jgi:hypothetical protein
MRATGFPLIGLALSVLSGCLTNVPDPELGGVYACAVQEDCPETLSCLQQVCEAIELPQVNVFNPEDGKKYPFVEGGTVTEIISVSATNLVIRGLSESAEGVPGEGHIVIFIDEVEAGVIDSGNLSSGVQMEIEIPNTPGVHRIRAQARLNNGIDYDNETAAARRLVWVDNGRKHIALRKPWPGDEFTVEDLLIDAEVALLDPMDQIVIGPPNTGNFHVHVFYDESFPACVTDNACQARYNGIVPNDETDDTNQFGPVLLPASGAGEVELTAQVMDSEHFAYFDELGEPVYSSITILRTDD